MPEEYSSQTEEQERIPEGLADKQPAVAAGDESPSASDRGREQSQIVSLNQLVTNLLHTACKAAEQARRTTKEAVQGYIKGAEQNWGNGYRPSPY